MTASPTLGSRALFPSLRHRIYANHASVGPLPLPAMDAMNAAMAAQAAEGVTAMLGFHEAMGTTRAVAGSLLGVPPAQVAVVGNTSAAISAVATGIPWSRGDAIVLFRGEFPANTTPWQQAARRHDLRLIWLDANDFADDHGLEFLEATLRDHPVRLVAVSAVQFNTGLRMPVEAMAALTQHHGSAIFVDAIQAMGATPFDATNIDYIASGGQKWLMGPPGTGLLYARDWSSLDPVLASWLSHDDGLCFLWGDPDRMDYERPLQNGPAIVEGGTLNFCGLAGLRASMELLQALGVEAVHAHINRWFDRLEPALRDLNFQSYRSANPPRQSTLMCVRPPPGTHAGWVAAQLLEHGISVATPDGYIRFSPSWPNSLDEADAVASVLTRVMSGPAR